MTSKALCRKKEYNIKDEPFVVTNTIPVQAFCQLRTAVHFQLLTEPQTKQVLAYLQTHVQPGVRIACSLYANPRKEPFYAAYGFQPLPNAQYGHGMLLELS